MLKSDEVQKVTQDLLLFVWFKHGALEEEPPRKSGIIPAISEEFMEHLSVLIWIESFRTRFIWDSFFKKHFERMTSSPELFSNYVFYVCYILNKCKNAHECFFDILSIVSEFSLRCLERNCEKYLNTCAKLFCTFFENEIDPKFQNQGGWEKFSTYIGDLYKSIPPKFSINPEESFVILFEYFPNALERGNLPGREVSRGVFKERKQPYYVVNGTILKDITWNQVETHEKSVGFSKNVLNELKYLIEITFDRLIRDFDEKFFKSKNQNEEIEAKKSYLLETIQMETKVEKNSSKGILRFPSEEKNNVTPKLDRKSPGERNSQRKCQSTREVKPSAFLIRADEPNLPLTTPSKTQMGQNSSKGILISPSEEKNKVTPKVFEKSGERNRQGKWPSIGEVKPYSFVAGLSKPNMPIITDSKTQVGQNSSKGTLLYSSEGRDKVTPKNDEKSPGEMNSQGKHLKFPVGMEKPEEMLGKKKKKKKKGKKGARRKDDDSTPRTENNKLQRTLKQDSSGGKENRGREYSLHTQEPRVEKKNNEIQQKKDKESYDRSKNQVKNYSQNVKGIAENILRKNNTSQELEGRTVGDKEPAQRTENNKVQKIIKQKSSSVNENKGKESSSHAREPPVEEKKNKKQGKKGKESSDGKKNQAENHSKNVKETAENILRKNNTSQEFEGQTITDKEPAPRIENNKMQGIIKQESSNVNENRGKESSSHAREPPVEEKKNKKQGKKGKESSGGKKNQVENYSQNVKETSNRISCENKTKGLDGKTAKKNQVENHSQNVQETLEQMSCGNKTSNKGLERETASDQDSLQTQNLQNSVVAARASHRKLKISEMERPKKLLRDMELARDELFEVFDCIQKEHKESSGGKENEVENNSQNVKGTSENISSDNKTTNKEIERKTAKKNQVENHSQNVTETLEQMSCGNKTSNKGLEGGTSRDQDPLQTQNLQNSVVSVQASHRILKIREMETQRLLSDMALDINKIFKQYKSLYKKYGAQTQVTRL